MSDRQINKLSRLQLHRRIIHSLNSLGVAYKRQLGHNSWSIWNNFDDYHGAFVFAYKNGAFEVQVIAPGELEGAEFGKEQFDAGMRIGSLLDIGQNGGIDRAPIRVEK